MNAIAKRISPDLFKDRIVLIGTTAPSFRDSLSIPYPTDRGEIQSIPGVVVQAQMVSQLIAAAIDGRPLIHSAPFWLDTLLVWGVAVGGGLLIWIVRRRLYAGVAGVGATIVLSGTCLFLLQSGYWVPLVPAAIASIVTGTITTLLHRSMNREI